MAHFSVLDNILDYKASTALWSHSASDRMLAATYLRLGDQLEAQWESNDIQRHLCALAIDTNDMLADIGSSLEELRVGQQRTNELLAKSVAVQTDHFMLDKRERVLKDALFRWSEILTNGHGVSDPHWVLIASRTLMVFMEQWSFSTEDLQDANEKRAFLDLTKRAKSSIKSCDKAVVSEVNVFQVLYAEYRELTQKSRDAKPPVFSSTEGVPDLDEVIDGFVVQCCGFRPTDPTPLIMLSGLPAAALDFYLMMSSKPPPMQGKRPLFGVYGRAGWVVSRVAVFTADAWYEIDCQSMFGNSGWVRKQYKQGSAFTFFDDYTLMNSLGDHTIRLEKAKRFASEVYDVVARHAQAIRDAAEKAAHAFVRFKRQVEERQKSHQNKCETATRRINEFLDLHPAVEEFYPRVCDPLPKS